MPRLTTLKAMKTGLMRGVFGAAVAALIAFQATGVAAQGERLWSIVVHFQYQSGFEFDYTIRRGVSATELGAALGECGSAHWIGAGVVNYYCYPVEE